VLTLLVAVVLAVPLAEVLWVETLMVVLAVVLLVVVLGCNVVTEPETEVVVLLGLPVTTLVCCELCPGFPVGPGCPPGWIPIR